MENGRSNNNNRMDFGRMNTGSPNQTTNRQHLYPGAFRAQLWGRNNTNFTGTNRLGLITPPLTTALGREEPEAPSLSLGERVVWVRDTGPEIGSVRWIGRLPTISPDWSVGVEFDNPISTGDGKLGAKQYFVTKPNHAVFLPIMALMRAQDYDGDRVIQELNKTAASQKCRPTQDCVQHTDRNSERRPSWERSCGDPVSPHQKHQEHYCCHCHNCESQFSPAGPGSPEEVACGHCKSSCGYGACGSTPVPDSHCAANGFVTSTPRNSTRHKSVTIKETLGGPGFEEWSDEDLNKFPFKSWTSSSRQSVVSCPASVGPRTILIAKKLSSDSSDSDSKNGKFKTLMSCFLPGQAYRSKKKKKKKRQKYILAQEQKQVAFLADGSQISGDSSKGPWRQQCDIHGKMSCSLHAIHKDPCQNHMQRRNLSCSGFNDSHCCNDPAICNAPNTTEPTRKKKPPPPPIPSDKQTTSRPFVSGSVGNVSIASRQNARDRFFLGDGPAQPARTSSFNNLPVNKDRNFITSSPVSQRQPAMRSNQPVARPEDMSRIISKFTYVGNSGRSQSLSTLNAKPQEPKNPLKAPELPTPVTISPHPRRSNKNKRAPQPPIPGSSLSLSSITEEPAQLGATAAPPLRLRSGSFKGPVLEGSQGQPRRENSAKKRMAPAPPALPRKTVAHDTLTLFGYFPREGTLSRSSSEVETKASDDGQPSTGDATKTEDQLLDDLIAEMNSLSRDISEMNTNTFTSASSSKDDKSPTTHGRLNLNIPNSPPTPDSKTDIKPKEGIYKEKPGSEAGPSGVAKSQTNSLSKERKTSQSSNDRNPKNQDKTKPTEAFENGKAERVVDTKKQVVVANEKISNVQYKADNKKPEASASPQTSPEKKKKNKKKKKGKEEDKDVDEVTEILCEIEQVVKSKPTVQDFVAAFTKFTEKAEQIAANHQAAAEQTPKKSKSKTTVKDESGKSLKSFPTKWLFNMKSDKKKANKADQQSNSNSLDRSKVYEQDKDNPKVEVVGKFETLPRGFKTKDTLEAKPETSKETKETQYQYYVPKHVSTESLNININVDTSPRQTEHTVLTKVSKSISTDDLSTSRGIRVWTGEHNSLTRRPKALADIQELQTLQDNNGSDLSQQPNQNQFFQNRDTLRRLSVENRKMRLGSNSSLNNGVREDQEPPGRLSPGVMRKMGTASPVLSRNTLTGKPPLPYKPLGEQHPMEGENKTLFVQLEAAIARGQHGRAAAIARELALQKSTGSFNRLKKQESNPEKNITVCLFIEDKKSHKGPIPFNITTNMTVKMLKEKVEKELDFAHDSQRWILGKSFVTNDSSTLESLNISTPGCPIFLYIVTPEKNLTTEAQANCTSTTPDIRVENVAEPAATVLQEPKVTVTERIEEAVEVREEEPARIAETELVKTPGEGPLLHGIEEPVLLEISQTQNGIMLIEDSDSSDVDEDVEEEEEDIFEEAEIDIETFETDHLSVESEENNEELKQNYQELVQLEERDLIANAESFECSICFLDVDERAGVVLRECLHSFCKECLGKAVEYSEEAVIKCPFRNNEYSCDSHLLEREIKALVPPELFDKHLARSVTVAESRAQNSFHCKTPDCPGWCLFEDNVNLFPCPVCGLENCLTCGAAHQGKDCRQYQDELEFEAALSDDAKMTKEYLDNMVKEGQAMHCPTCRVIVMKKWGCDWVKCSVCQTEICWVTKGPRWGPAGRGDTSAGCKCGVNGVKCHQKCNYCH